MCYLQVYLVFDFSDESTLKNTANVGRCLSALVREGNFHLANEDFESPEAAWSNAVRLGQRGVYVALENAHRYSLSFSVITNNWRRLYLTVNRDQSDKAENIHTLVAAGETLYKNLAPDYGFGLVSMDMTPLDPVGEGDYGITTLYDLNFLSPRLAKKLRYDQITSVQYDWLHEFSDGGLLLQMSPNPLVDKKATLASYQEAAAILGLSKFQQGC